LEITTLNNNTFHASTGVLAVDILIFFHANMVGFYGSDHCPVTLELSQEARDAIA
jgi:hypothetical protein